MGVEQGGPDEGLVNSEALTRAQHSSLQEMTPKLIPSGTEVPTEIIAESAGERGLVLNLGCGTGKKVTHLAASYPEMEVVGVDFNASAIRQAIKRNRLPNAKFMVADVTQGESLSQVAGERSPNVIVAEGLFTNLIGWDVAEALANINRLMSRGTDLLVADCLAADQVLGYDLILDREFGGDKDKLWSWVNQWLDVYKENQLLFGPMERHTFVVFNPEISNRWSYKFDQIYDLWSHHNFERVARHWDFEIFKGLCRNSGLSYKGHYLTIWHGRSGDPLLGFVARFQRLFDIDLVNQLSPAQNSYSAFMIGAHVFDQQAMIMAHWVNSEKDRS